MDRRESIKSILVGSLAGGMVVNGCEPVKETNENEPLKNLEGVYGRTPEEKARDARLNEENFFSIHEMETVSTLCDLILPATKDFGSASDAGVPDFIAFIVKDLPNYQLPIRGGIMWLDHHASKLFELDFKKLSTEQQKSILDTLAFPDGSSDLSQGVRFFNLVRNLVLTGYYTSEMGIKELGYQGNMPGVWDGVPDDVLKAHGLAYDDDWLSKCVDQSKRMEQVIWDDNGNLIN
jgi:hypothetical protein